MPLRDLGEEAQTIGLLPTFNMMSDEGRPVVVHVAREAVIDMPPPGGSFSMARFEVHRQAFAQAASDKFDKGLVDAATGDVVVLPTDLP